MPSLLTMDLLETDDVLPSFRVSIKVEHRPTSATTTVFETTTWFSCSAWDAGVAESRISLRSLSGDVDISVHGGEFCVLISRSVDEFRIAISAKISREDMRLIHDSLERIPRWWLA